MNLAKVLEKKIAWNESAKQFETALSVLAEALSSLTNSGQVYEFEGNHTFEDTNTEVWLDVVNSVQSLVSTDEWTEFFERNDGLKVASREVAKSCSSFYVDGLDGITPDFYAAVLHLYAVLLLNAPTTATFPLFAKDKGDGFNVELFDLEQQVAWKEVRITELEKDLAESRMVAKARLDELKRRDARAAEIRKLKQQKMWVEPEYRD